MHFVAINAIATAFLLSRVPCSISERKKFLPCCNDDNLDDKMVILYLII